MRLARASVMPSASFVCHTLNVPSPGISIVTCGTCLPSYTAFFCASNFLASVSTRAPALVIAALTASYSVGAPSIACSSRETSSSLIALALRVPSVAATRVTSACALATGAGAGLGASGAGNDASAGAGASGVTCTRFIRSMPDCVPGGASRIGSTRRVSRTASVPSAYRIVVRGTL